MVAGHSSERQQCHTNFGRYAKEVLDGGPSSHVTPAFGEEKAFQFFSEVYHSGVRNYVQPPWMPTPPPPSVEMDCSLFTATDIMRVIKKLKSCSAPSPFDRVGYVIFKKPMASQVVNTVGDLSVVEFQSYVRVYMPSLSPVVGQARTYIGT